MKAALKSRRPSPDEAVRIAVQAAPELPPARMVADDKQQPFSTRFRASTIAALEAEAKQQGISMKLVITKALAAAGVKVADADLMDGTPRRRAA